MKKCKLCQQENELIKASHIIPNFMYDGILEKNKKMVQINLFTNDKLKYRPTPTYEKHILCKECDTKILSRLETYAAEIIYNKNKKGNIEVVTEKEDGVTSLILKGIDYKKFKLFSLSILWRASISKSDLFSEVALGPKHEEALRRMIYENDPGEPTDYPVCIFGIKTKEKLPLNIVIQPRRLKIRGNTSYMFFINGLFYYFNISKHLMQDLFNRLPIDRHNEVTIGLIEGSFGEDFFDKFIGKKIRMNKVSGKQK